MEDLGSLFVWFWSSVVAVLFSSCALFRCFTYRGAQLWNNLSAEVKTASIAHTLSQFKAAYKNSK